MRALAMHLRREKVNKTRPLQVSNLFELNLKFSSSGLKLVMHHVLPRPEFNKQVCFGQMLIRAVIGPRHSAGPNIHPDIQPVL
jgi:hypothetical protein